MKKVAMKVHPLAAESLKRFSSDLKAGHLGAAEYWRGQASAYFTANPITQKEITELVNLYHLAQTTVGHKRYDRLVWAAKEFHKMYPDISTTKAYKEADYATRPYLNPVPVVGQAGAYFTANPRRVGGTIIAATLSDARTKSTRLRTLGYTNIRTERISPQSPAHQAGYKYWISYDIPKSLMPNPRITKEQMALTCTNALWRANWKTPSELPRARRVDFNHYMRMSKPQLIEHYQTALTEWYY